jgi:TatD DNase family protein
MENTCKLIDTHAHLDFENYRECLDEIIGNAKDAGVEKIIIPGVTLRDVPEIIKIIDKYDDIYGAVSVHPSEAKDWQDGDYNRLKNYAQHEKIVAIGETGLDYYWDKSFIDKQQHVFREHIRLAGELNLPLIVHNREAHADTLEIVQEFPGVKGVMHCFSGSAEFALECVKIGYYIALGGPVTFKNAKKPKEVAEKVPLEWLLVETDAPFLAPHPFRGKQNEPGLVKLVAETIAEIKDISFEEVARATSRNAEKLFKI